LSQSLPVRSLRADEFSALDAINEDIWSRSAAFQQELQAARRNWAVGEVGAQQAMCGPRALPWVPDLVGAEFGLPGSVLVVGMSYAGFLRRDPSRSGYMTPESYRDHATARDFCAHFVNSVVPHYPYYQRVLDAFPPEVPLRRVGFTDLCRANLVRIEKTRDSCQGIERCGRSLFARYAEHPEQRQWHACRILESGVEVLVALGQVAEHGLLRLLRDVLDCNVTTEDREVVFSRRSGPLTWPTAYAHDARQIDDWMGAKAWWSAGGPRGHWKVVTVPHPSQNVLRAHHTERIQQALA
jgi:hypothetical protein